ncbi:MAG: serine/threonine protein kinase [Planctomycetes bacterium]|nr:serine/threonine protein kinase [Planctomycetota bacterium]
MTKRVTSCDSERLRLLLADQLPDEFSAETSQHVAACPRCRAELERLAGEPAWWSEVAECLSAGRRQESEPGTEDRTGSGVSFAQHDRSLESSPAERNSRPLAAGDSLSADDFFASDFAVEFLAPSERPEALGRLGDHEILEVIGRGGMGVVLKGYQPDLGRYVAIKVMAPHLAAGGSARQRFAREAKAAAAIVHPHVMAIHSVNTAGRLPYLVMPYIACESLQQRLDRSGPLELCETLRIGVQTAAGLAAAHAQGLVHRDVKPANILLELDVDRVMLNDFGLARAADDASLTRTGVIAGTPQYMSPEQARGDAVDHRADLFSLGSVLYTICAGRLPFRAETSYGVLRRITDTHPRPIREIHPDIPEWLTRIIARLHAKDPSERFSSAGEVSRLLEQCLAHVQQPTAVALPEQLREERLASGERNGAAGFRRSRPRRFIAGLAVVMVAAGLGAWALLQNQPPERASQDQSHAARMSGDAADSSAATWDDGATEQLDDLGAAADDLKDRTMRLWDEPNTTSPQEDSP